MFALLWSLLNPLFYEHIRGHHEALEPVMGKGFVFWFFLFFCLSGNPMVWVAISD